MYGVGRRALNDQSLLKSRIRRYIGCSSCGAGSTKRFRSEPLGVRMKLITESLLGKPYLLNGIGEMQEPDPDPIGAL